VGKTPAALGGSQNHAACNARPNLQHTCWKTALHHPSNMERGAKREMDTVTTSACGAAHDKEGFGKNRKGPTKNATIIRFCKAPAKQAR